MRDPLGPVSAESGVVATQGSVVVSLYQGSTPAPAYPPMRVTILKPDGSRSDGLTAQGTFAGQAAVQFGGLTQAGTYRFGLTDQNSRNVQWTSLALGPGTQAINVPLQLSGSALALVDVQPFQANDYKFVSGTWRYTVAWTNASAMQTDLVLDLDPATVPLGWTYNFSPAVLQAGQSSTLTVNYAEATLTPTALLAVRGRTGNTVIGLATQVIPRNWTMNLTAVFSNYTPLGTAPYTAHIPWNGTLNIAVQVSGTQLPVGAFATVELPNQAAASTTFRQNCGWMDTCSQSTSSPVSILVNGGANIYLSNPMRTWSNWGWKLWEVFDCHLSDGGVIETFVFKVRLGASDIFFSKDFNWPRY